MGRSGARRYSPCVQIGRRARSRWHSRRRRRRPRPGFSLRRRRRGPWPPELPPRLRRGRASFIGCSYCGDRAMLVNRVRLQFSLGLAGNKPLATAVRCASGCSRSRVKSTGAAALDGQGGQAAEPRIDAAGLQSTSQRCLVDVLLTLCSNRVQRAAHRIRIAGCSAAVPA